MARFATVRWPRRDITKYISHFHVSAFSTFAFPCFRIFNFCISMFPHFQLLHFPVSAFSYFRIFMFLYFHIFVFSCFHILYTVVIFIQYFLRNSSIVIVYIGTGCTLFRQYTTATLLKVDLVINYFPRSIPESRSSILSKLFVYMLINLLNYIVVQLRAATITKRLLCLLYYSQTGCSLASNIAILSHNIAILIGRLFWTICKRREQIGRGLLVKIISLRGTNVGSTWFVVYLKGIIGTLLRKKFPSKKTCPLPRKWVINDYPLLNCITAKNWFA